MPNFIISEPIDIPTKRDARGDRIVDQMQFRQLVREESEWFNKAGCYVFSTKSGRGSMPFYVGKNPTRISARITGAKNLVILNRILAGIKRGRLQVWTITQSGRGPRSTKAMDQIAATLVQVAVRKNSDLLNTQSTTGDNWIIEGMQPGRGRQPEKAKRFRSMIARNADEWR